MKNLKNLILFITIALSIGACKNVDFGDTNKNTNGPTSTDTQTLLTAAMKNFATLTGREYLIRPTLNVQYQVQAVYNQEMRYNEVASYWSQYYSNELSELQEIIDFLDDPSNITPSVINKGAIVNQKGVAMIFKAVIFKRLTDTFGDIPYSESLNGLNELTPVYDSQESVYKDIINQVKTARDLMDASLNGPAGDIIYNGDISRWKKFANSFILEASLQLSKKYPGASGYAATEFNAALTDSNGVIESVGDEAWFTFYNPATAQHNPWSENRARDYNLSKELTDAMKGNTGGSSVNPTSNHTQDLRLKVYSSDWTDDGVVYHDPNGGGGGAQMDKVHFWNVKASLPLLTASYTYLNRADAANLGWTSEDKSAMLQQGIIKSYESLNYNKIKPIFDEGESDDEVASVTELTTYATNTYAPARVADAVANSFAQVIGEEKWISLFPQGFQAWAEWRRTGYPNLIPRQGDYLNDGNIPRRYIYPSGESGLNGDNYQAAVNALVPPADKNTSRVWWDQ